MKIFIQTFYSQVGHSGSGSVSRVTSRQSSTCSTIAQGGPRLLGVHTRGASQTRSGSSVNSTPCLSRDNSRASGSGASSGQNNIHVQTSFDSGYGVHSYLGKDGKRETLINDVYKKGGAAGSQPTPTVTVINADSEHVGAKHSSSSQPGAGATVGGAFLGDNNC